MTNRTITHRVKGQPAVDGDGVHLVRVLGNQTVKIFDPILMLDSFDSTNPEDYIAGFPLHPHRGIETVSYLYKGKMMHKDSTGGEDTIGDGEVQWMNAGSGIMHEERIPEAERMLGVQMWLNLPAKDKMSKPFYLSIKNDSIQEIPFEGGMLRLLAGQYQGAQGYQAAYAPLDYYDIHLEAGGKLAVDVLEDASVMAFTLLGNVTIAGEHIEEKTAVKFSAGDRIEFEATDGDAQILFMSSKALNEPIAWMGPIVMNTQAELEQAFKELRSDEFVKEKLEIPVE